MSAIARPEFASPEFVSLCQAQLRLLTQHLSNTAAALYIADIAEPGGEDSNFVPVVSYPGTVDSWVANFEKAAAPWSKAEPCQPQPLALPGDESAQATTQMTEQASSLPPSIDSEEEPLFQWPEALSAEQQLVMPMVYTDVVVGLLVAVRPEGDWNSEERQHVERVAQSLAGGCVLERRNQWLQRQLAQKNGLQSRQSEIFHNLLHQFRNPLTAVSTFGQLLVKRLEPEDPNWPIATGIVRENKRLRELVTHFDEAVAIGDADLTAQSQTKPISRLSAGQPLLLAEHQAPDVGENSQGLGQPLAISAQYLPDIVGPVLGVANIVASEQGVDLHSQVASDTPLVWGEEEALGEVVTNLVDNAIKYSASPTSGQNSSDTLRPQVWVQTGVSRVGRGEHAGSQASGGYSDQYQGIVVGDTGPGIPAEDLTHLFERNYRGVQAEGEIPGTGLGLAIAHSLIQEMHGSIEVISPAVGTPWMPSTAAQSGTGPGTVFIVWLQEVERL